MDLAEVKARRLTIVSDDAPTVMLTDATRVPAVSRLAGTLEDAQAGLRAQTAVLAGLALALVDVQAAVQARGAGRARAAVAAAVQRVARAPVPAGL